MKLYNNQGIKRDSRAAAPSLVLCGLLLTLGLAQSVAGQEHSALWGDLTPGPYGIGFRTIFSYDLARPPVPYSDWDGRLYPMGDAPGRQMQISVWYPAEATTADRRLAFGDYVDLMARQTDFGPTTSGKTQFANDQFVWKTNALGGNGDFTNTNLDSLREMETAAFDAPNSSAGQFPVVVFPNGGSPAFQSIMSEYFASHGFIVAAAALKGQFGFTEDISVRGFEAAVDDLGFLLNEVLRIEQADNEKICLIGNAITSAHIVAYQTRNSRIDCLVSLDGGLLSQFEQRLLQQTAFYEPHAVNKPILAIHAPHPAIDPEHISHLEYSMRYLIHFPQMSEFHFLNYGAFETFVPGIIGQTDGDVRKGFELAAEYCLRFFEAYLNENLASREFLSRDPEPDNRAHIDAIEVRTALESPPNIATLKNGFLNHGIEYIRRIYDGLKTVNPMPFPRSYYDDLKDWLAWKKDPEFENRYQLYRLALDSYPESATINYYLAYFSLETGRDSVSRSANRRTLELLETDTSRELTPERIETMRRIILQDLERLDQRSPESQ